MGIFTGIRNIARGLSRMAYGDLQSSRVVDIGNPTSDFWFTDLAQSTASINVTDAVAMTYSAVWSATRLLSSTIGDLPLDLYRRLPGGGREVALKDRREYLVHDRPNDEMTAMLFRCQASQQQVNAGNCYALIEQDSLGNVIGLMPIHHSRVYPMRDRGRLVYEVKNDGGTSTYIAPEDMLHVPSMMSDDGIVGKGVIRQARESIGFGIATERYGASWFGAGAQPKVIVESPKQMNPEARDNFRKEWRETYGGPEGNKVAVLTAGMKASTLNISAQDQQFLETRQHNVEEIARWYGVPPHMIQQLLRATFSNIEEQGIEFVVYSLMPWLKIWEQELNAKLLRPEERDSMYFEFNVNGLLRGNSQARATLYQSGITTGWLTPNEVCGFENLMPYPEGDKHYMQGAMMPVDMLGKQAQAAADSVADTEETDAEDDPDEPEDTTSTTASGERERVLLVAARTMFVGAVERMIRKESHEARNAAKNPKKFCDWLDSAYGDEFAGLFAEAIEPTCTALSAMGYTADPHGIAFAHGAISLSELTELANTATPATLAAEVDAKIAAWPARATALAETILRKGT